MRTLLLIFLLLVSVYRINSQTTRGLSLIEPPKPEPTGKTYALIVGISNYQSKDITNLQFADKDAKVFYNYLITIGVPPQNIKLMLNDSALFGNIWAEVAYLNDVAQKSDKVYIYFSGHGDVEHKTIGHRAYLLPYDAPSVTYVKGAIDVGTLKDYFATLSSKGVQLIFIADACRAGNLVGGIEGMTTTAEVLKDVWQDEIKILSCDKGQSSLESKQWGGGRGLFSFELINGLCGKADRNNDGKVTLHELKLYLDEKVPDEANPILQDPVVEGNNKDDYVLTKVTPALKALAVDQPSNLIATIDLKGSEKMLLENLPDSIIGFYHSFQACMDTGNYITLENDSMVNFRFTKNDSSIKQLPSALYYYQNIPENDNTKMLLAFMKRNLSAALMNDLQSIDDTSSLSYKKLLSLKINEKGDFLKNYLSAILSTNRLWGVEGFALRALLGEEKLKQLGFYSKGILYEANAAATGNSVPKMKEMNVLLDTAIKYSPEMPELYLVKGGLSLKMLQKDAALKNYQKVFELSPNSLSAFMAVIQVINIYVFTNKKDSCLMLARMCYNTKYNIKYYDVNIVQKLLLIQSFLQYGEVDSAKLYYPKFKECSTDIADTVQKRQILFSIADIASALSYCDDAINYYRLASDGKFNSNGPAYNLACCLSKSNEKEKALNYLETSIQNGFKDFDHIEKDDDLNNIRSTPEFKTMMKKYFPNDYKE